MTSSALFFNEVSPVNAIGKLYYKFSAQHSAVSTQHSAINILARDAQAKPHRRGRKGRRGTQKNKGKGMPSCAKIVAGRAKMFHGWMPIANCFHAFAGEPPEQPLHPNQGGTKFLITA